MTGELLVKIMVGSVIASGSVWLGGTMIRSPELIKRFFASEINVFVKTENLNPPQSVDPVDEIIDDEKDKNFKCKVGEEDPFSCSITKPDLTDTESKKHFAFDDFKDSSEQSGPTKDKLKVANNIYKITMLSHQFNWDTHKDKKIEILSTKQEETNKKYASTVPLFFLDRNRKQGTTQQFLGKASESSKTEVDISKYQCSWKEDGSDPKTCTVHEFAESETAPKDQKDHTDLTFNSSSSEATKIAKHRHYIIKFTTDKHAFEIINTPLIVLVETNNNGADKIKFTNIKPTTTVGEKLIII